MKRGLIEALERQDRQQFSSGPRLTCSVSVQPASSSTQHPHCPLCQGAKAALHSSGGCLRRTHYRYMLALARPSVWSTQRKGDRGRREEMRNEMHMEVIESYRKDKPIRQLNSLQKVLKSLRKRALLSLLHLLK